MISSHAGSLRYPESARRVRDLAWGKELVVKKTNFQKFFHTRVSLNLSPSIFREYLTVALSDVQNGMTGTMLAFTVFQKGSLTLVKI